MPNCSKETKQKPACCGGIRRQTGPDQAGTNTGNQLVWIEDLAQNYPGCMYLKTICLSVGGMYCVIPSQHCVCLLSLPHNPEAEHLGGRGFIWLTLTGSGTCWKCGCGGSE